MPQDNQSNNEGGLETMAVKKDYTIDVLRLLDQLKDQVEGIKSLGPVTMGFRRDDLIFQIEKVKASMPRDVRDAANLTRERERMLEEAKAEAESTISQAKREAEAMVSSAQAEAKRLVEEARIAQERMVDESEVLKIAQAQADELRVSAEKSSRRLRRESEDYALEVLTKLESTVNKVQVAIERGRTDLEEVRAEEQQAVTREREKNKV